MRKLGKRTGFFWLLIGCIFCGSVLIFSGTNYAAGGKPGDNREIFVGYSERDDIIQMNENGEFYGYGVSYLDELSKYTGWDYRYVKIPEGEEISSLLEGKIDLLCNLPRDCVQKEELIFSQEEVGIEYGMLCGLRDNYEIFFQDYKAISGKKIGVVPGGNLEKSLEEYAKENGISYKLVYFENYKELKEALQKQSVDMALVSSLKETRDFKYVGKTEQKELYAAVSKEHAFLMEEWDKASRKMWQDNPFFRSSSYESFYGNPAQKLTGLTREEYEVIRHSQPLRVAYDANSYPLEYTDEKTGEYAGVYAAAMELIAEESGLKFEFVPLEDFSEVWDMAASGEVDLIAGTYANDKMAECYHMIYSKTYLSAKYTLIGQKDLEVKDGISIALPENYVGLRYFFQLEEPAWEIALYESVKDCLKAVNNGKADVTAVNSIFLQTTYNLKYYKNLKTIEGEEKDFPISMGIGSGHGKELKSILDKAIDRIPQQEFESCVMKYTINMAYEPTTAEVLTRFFPHICVVLLGIAVLAAALVRKGESHFRSLAMTDSVTGLWNRVKFYQNAHEILEKNRDKTYLLIVLDINKFKFINNDFGSKVGDKILYVLGERIQDIFAEKGYFARNTADLFLILIEEKDYKPEMLEPLNQAIHFDNNGKRQYYKIVVKAGIRRILPGEDRTDLILYADQASMARKTIKDVSDKNQAYYDEKMKRTLERENAIEKKMESALADEEFQVYLQPKYDLRSEQVMGAEALVRWIDSEKGMVPPDEFIPLFEKNGFILKVDFYVYEEVLKRMARWKAEGKELICVSVNVSRVHISTADFFTNLNRLMEKYKIPKRYFELELTETIMGGEMGLIKTFIQECKKEGYKVSIDDFGSGYSSLNLLKELPVDILKIDKGFLDEAEESRRSNIIVEQVVEMAKRMEIKTLCEGVETKKQLSFLKRIGCDMAQGYLFSKPIPMEEFEKMI